MSMSQSSGMERPSSCDSFLFLRGVWAPRRTSEHKNWPPRHTSHEYSPLRQSADGARSNRSDWMDLRSETRMCIRFPGQRVSNRTWGWGVYAGSRAWGVGFIVPVARTRARACTCSWHHRGCTKCLIVPCNPQSLAQQPLRCPSIFPAGCFAHPVAPWALVPWCHCPMLPRQQCQHLAGTVAALHQTLIA